LEFYAWAGGVERSAPSPDLMTCQQKWCWHTPAK